LGAIHPPQSARQGSSKIVPHLAARPGRRFAAVRSAPRLRPQALLLSFVDKKA